MIELLLRFISNPLSFLVTVFASALKQRQKKLLLSRMSRTPTAYPVANTVTYVQPPPAYNPYDRVAKPAQPTTVVILQEAPKPMDMNRTHVPQLATCAGCGYTGVTRTQ